MQNESYQNRETELPLSLEQMLGEQYQYFWDPAVKDQRDPDPWFRCLACRYGEIYRYSNDLLAVLVIGPKIAARIKREQPFRAHQDGEDATVFLFSPDQFPIVAKYVQPKRKRRLPSEFKQRFADQGRRNLAIINGRRHKSKNAA